MRRIALLAAPDSDDLLARARQLDAEALALIHDQHYPEVYRYVCYRLAENALCEDIAAEVFLRLLDALHQQRGPERNLRAWLLGTASNLVNDQLRKRYTHRVESLDEEMEQTLSDGTSLEAGWEQKWQHQRLRAAIRRLTTDQQQVVVLRFGEGQSLEETAGLMGKNVNAVKALQFRALAALKKILDKR